MKKMFVLFAVLVVGIYALSVCTSKHEAKDGDEVKITANNRIEILRARVLDEANTVPYWGFVMVEHPADNITYKFRRWVTVLNQGSTSSEGAVNQRRFKAGDEIYFTLISSSSATPMPVSELTLSNPGTNNMAVEVPYGNVSYTGADSKLILLNPKK